MAARNGRMLMRRAYNLSLRTTSTKGSQTLSQAAQVRYRCKGSEGSQDGGGFSSFKKTFKEKIEGDAEMKKTMADLEKQAEMLKGRAGEGQAAIMSSLGKLAEAAQGITKQAKTATETLSETVTKTSSGVRSAVSSAADKASESELLKDAKTGVDKLKEQATQAFKPGEDDGKSGPEAKATQAEGASSEKNERGSTLDDATENSEGDTASASPKAEDKAEEQSFFKRIVSTVVGAYKEEYRLAMMSENELETERMQKKVTAEEERLANQGPLSDRTEVTLSEVKQTGWEKRWGWIKEKAEGSQAFDRLQGTAEGVKKSAFYAKAQENVEDMRERWETSDSRVVAGLQNTYDSFTQENEQARAYRIIRERDGDFDMIRFMNMFQEDIPVILTAYLKGDMETLKNKQVGSELQERMAAQMAPLKADGLTVDNQILDTSAVELVEVFLQNENPMILLRCSCQQVNCVRDKFGNVTEGAVDDIQSVAYAWVLEQDGAETASPGAPPKWIVREMQVQGMQAIV
ncbi:hypothetical protein CYMTET_51929 [Cymbomonas tetramitiformis]|uniref:Tim44-like domain-containing protein n=1 Tax=Cymbomonas tetramitiformis TaxID=36881 RepID=A0AAE0ERV1_9CHLO|nr:hypothetical protein CYMTET_51929 [Cymbomonas tetramitiformis]